MMRNSKCCREEKGVGMEIVAGEGCTNEPLGGLTEKGTSSRDRKEFRAQ